tara:strand:+ start:7555 stop:8529 length:975 start_codon:yes stop_codon:yes gene_type:complete
MAHTGFAQTTRDYGRIGTNIRKSLVDEVLPEHFREDYPNLVTFLDAYYEHLDSADTFGGIIQELQTIRDVEDAKLEFLDFMFDEIALGVSNSFFTNPREALRNFGNFFRVKGSEYSVHGFFRAFFQEEIEIIYPKEKLFRVSQSSIGEEEGFKLQDGGINQIFSTLIKAPLPIVEWEELYRNFVHPAGFFLGASVTLEAQPQLTIGTAESISDPNTGRSLLHSQATLTSNAEGEVIGALSEPPSLSPLYDGLDSDTLRDRYSIYRNLNDYPGLTIADVQKYYNKVYEWGGFYASFDDFADSANASAIRFSSTLDDFSSRVYFRK